MLGFARYFKEFGRLLRDEWKPVPGYEGLYQVSSEGKIYSLHGRRSDGSMRGSIDRYGYRCVLLSKDGKAKRHKVHRLVALAFHGNSRNASHPHVAHLNGHKDDNRAENLKWVSPKENTSHKVLHGTNQAGERHPRAKLSNEDVLAIRASTKSCRALARELGLGTSTIIHIRSRRRWANI